MILKKKKLVNNIIFEIHIWTFCCLLNSIFNKIEQGLIYEGLQNINTCKMSFNYW
jgi:hypothetical protein